MALPTPPDSRSFEFRPTPAVAASRSRKRFVRCPACQSDAPRYLFHNVGVRFVRCGACDMVYVNPSTDNPINYFDLAAVRRFKSDKDRDLVVASFGHLLGTIEEEWNRLRRAPLERTLLLGCYLSQFRDLPIAQRLGLDFPAIDEAIFRELAGEANLAPVSALLERRPQVVILHELLEACRDPGALLERLIAVLPADTIFVVTYTNVESIPARLMRRYWPRFFEVKSAFFSPRNLTSLLGRFGLVLRAHFPLTLAHTVGYVADRLVPDKRAARVLHATPLDGATVPLRAGNAAAIFSRASRPAPEREKLSIVLPVYNEARYVAQVIDVVLAKPLGIDKELIIIESN